MAGRQTPERTVAWSTRELAELAGTTVRAIRHYHEVGLLDEPERRANGYKQYDVAHLVRLRRIKHLSDLGFSLGEVGAMGEHDPSPQSVYALDTELATTVDRLQRARAELRTILRHSPAVDPQPEQATAGGARRPGARLVHRDRART